MGRQSDNPLQPVWMFPWQQTIMGHGVARSAWECPSSFRRLCTCHIIIGYIERCWLLELGLVFFSFFPASKTARQNLSV